MEKKFSKYEKIKLATIVTGGLGAGWIVADLMAKLYDDGNGSSKTDIIRWLGGVGLGTAACLASAKAIDTTFQSAEKIVEVIKSTREARKAMMESDEDMTETEETESND